MRLLVWGGLFLLFPTGALLFLDSAMDNRAHRQRVAFWRLKSISSAQADFRANDRDGNKVQDFWTGDVAGLYTLKGQDGEPIRLIEPIIAWRDGAPLEDGAANGRYQAGERVLDEETRPPKTGYLYRVMKSYHGKDGLNFFQNETLGIHEMGPVHNNFTFGFTAYPLEYGGETKVTFIINETSTIYWKDLGGKPALVWPTEEELKTEWTQGEGNWRR